MTSDAMSTQALNRALLARQRLLARAPLDAGSWLGRPLHDAPSPGDLFMRYLAASGTRRWPDPFPGDYFVTWFRNDVMKHCGHDLLSS